MSYLVFGPARTPTIPVIQATQTSQTSIRVDLSVASVEATTGIKLYRLYRSIRPGPYVQVGALTQSQFPYTDTVQAGSACDYYAVGVNNATNADSSAPSAITTATTPMSGPSRPSVIKWNPGVYLQTPNINDGGSKADIDYIVQALTLFPGLAGNDANGYPLTSWSVGKPLGANPIVTGYVMWRSWPFLQPTSKGAYTFGGGVTTVDSLDWVMAYLQSQIPGARLMLGIRTYANWNNNAFSATAGRSCVPTYINSDAATYGVPSTGGTGSGWILANYNGSGYQFVFANLANNNVMNEVVALVGAVGAHVCPTPYNGQTYTYNNHPLFENINDFTPDDVNMAGGNPTVPSSWSVAAFQANWNRRNTMIRSVLPNTSYAVMPGFGAGTAAQQKPLVDSIAQNGIALSTTDCTTNLTDDNPNLSYAFHFAFGDKITGTDAQGNPLWGPSANADYRVGPVTAFMPTIQPFDLVRGSTYTGHAAPDYGNAAPAQVGKCLNIAYNTYKASHVLLTMASSANYPHGPGPYTANGYDPKQFPTYIAAQLLAAGGVPIANRAYPSNYP